MKVAAHIDIKEAPMSSIATSRRRRAASPPRRRPTAPHRSLPRRRRRLDRGRRASPKALAPRRRLRRIHQALPPPAPSRVDALPGAFTRPTFLRFGVLALAAILTVGRRTVCALLRTLGPLAPGHPASYHK